MKTSAIRAHLPLGCAALFAIACEPVGVEGAPAPAAWVHALTVTPACFRPPPQEAESVDPIENQARWDRESATYNTSVALEWTELMIAPLREEPTREEWDIDRDGARLSGRTLARTEDAGRLMVSWTDETSADNWYASAHVEHTPTVTTVDVADFTVLVGDAFVMRDGLGRGCDAAEGWSFDIGPSVIDGVREPRVLRCWGGAVGADAAQRCQRAAERVLYKRHTLDDPLGDIPVQVLSEAET